MMRWNRMVALPLFVVLVGLAVGMGGVVILAPSSPPSRPFPWSTFSQAAPALESLEVGWCPGGIVGVRIYRHQGARYLVLVPLHPLPAPLVLLYDPRPDDPASPPTEWGVGRLVDPDVVPPLRWAWITPGFTSCPLLFPGERSV